MITRVDRARWQEAVKTSLEPTAECVGLLLSALDAADALREAASELQAAASEIMGPRLPQTPQVKRVLLGISAIGAALAAYDALVEPPRA